MNCINKLREIGIENISAKTRITQDKIIDIIECRFENFDKTRAKGFIQIIQREFNIDLSEWSKAYDDYYNEHMSKIEDKEINQEDDISSKINIPIQNDKKNNPYVKLIVILVCLCVLFVVYFIYNNFYSSNDNANTTIDENNETIIDNNNTSVLNNNIIDNNATMSNNATIKSNSSLQNESQIQDVSKNTGTKEETNNVIDNLSTQNQEELTITPKEPLWIGIIDLDTHKKKQTSTMDSYTIKLDSDKLILTGHSYFDIKAPNLDKHYIGGNKKYFLFTIKDGLKEITKKEFLELNRGEEW